MATIQVFRPATKYRDRARKYELLVDGAPLAKISHGETVDLQVSEGHHAVQAKIDWATTPTVEIDVAADETVALRIAPGSGPAIVNVMRPSKYLTLEVVPPAGPPS